MSFDAIAELERVLAERGLRSERQGQSVFISEANLAVSGILVSIYQHANCVLAQLDSRIESAKLGGWLLVESFAGMGCDESDAVKDAFVRFMRASLHVLLAALVDPSYGDHQVESETWRLGGRNWRAFLGPILQHGSLAVTSECSRLLDRLRDELPSLSDEPHWLRVFLMKSGRNQMGAEALLDNRYWSGGQQIVDAWDWPEDHFRVGHFLMLVPVKQ